MFTRNHDVRIKKPRSNREIWLLCAYQMPKNQAEARSYIYSVNEVELNEGRHILPITAKLREEGLIEWINPDTPPSRGKIHQTTEKGKAVIKEWMDKQTSINNRFSMGI